MVCENCKEEIRQKLTEMREVQLKRSGGHIGAFEAGVIVSFLNELNKKLTGGFLPEV